MSRKTNIQGQYQPGTLHGLEALLCRSLGEGRWASGEDATMTKEQAHTTSDWQSGNPTSADFKSCHLSSPACSKSLYVPLFTGLDSSTSLENWELNPFCYQKRIQSRSGSEQWRGSDNLLINLLSVYWWIEHPVQGSVANKILSLSWHRRNWSSTQLATGPP